MPDLPISGLPAGAALSAADPFVTVQAGVTVQVPASDVAAFAAKVIRPTYTVGNWYPGLQATAAAGSTLSGGGARFHPFSVTELLTIDELGAQVTTASAGGNFQLAIFANDPATNKPTGLPLGYTAATLSTGAAVASVTGALNVSVQLDPLELYWLCIACDNVVAIFGCWASGVNIVPFMMGAPNLSDYQGNATQQNSYYSTAHVYAADLSTLNVVPASVALNGATVVRMALIHFHVASIP